MAFGRANRAAGTPVNTEHASATEALRRTTQEPTRSEELAYSIRSHRRFAAGFGVATVPTLVHVGDVIFRVAQSRIEGFHTASTQGSTGIWVLSLGLAGLTGLLSFGHTSVANEQQAELRNLKRSN